VVDSSTAVADTASRSGSSPPRTSASRSPALGPTYGQRPVLNNVMFFPTVIRGTMVPFPAGFCYSRVAILQRLQGTTIIISPPYHQNAYIHLSPSPTLLTDINLPLST
jgi:hypothetical protein